MNRWLRALAPLLLTLLAIVTFLTIDRILGMLLIVVALAVAFLSGRAVLGRVPTRPEGDIDAQEVRAYRESHPGTSIGDAATAVGRDRS
ncbi:hypothetical protein [Clavibacter michiganensis]|uniref:Uncharacterized protein n=1 Tax=Clavibacter michiganensis TaxID=28447 RepID=A0A251YHF3_9MICO|nr:hypothetical protein [Clavibacter michiganensis]OUE23667.1 hypothetical protein BFL37_13465 [Clavibacter michiganensis]